MSHEADRNMLFGLLALQNDFISREDLLVAASVWLQDKSQKLDEILVDRKLLDSDEHAVLSQLVRKHLDRHDNNVEQSLAAVNAVDQAVHNQLQKLGDKQIENDTLAQENKRRADAEAAARKEAEAQKKQAMQRLREAREAVDGWIVGGSEALIFYPGAQRARKNLLEKAVEDYERFAAQKSDVELEVERGRAYLRLGDVHRRFGEPAEAEKAYQRAAEVFQAHPDDTTCQVELANLHNRLGLVFADTGEDTEADKAYQDA